MKCYLDSNFLVYYINQDSEYHDDTKGLMNELIDQETRIYISSLCIDEFLFQVSFLIKKKYRTVKYDMLENCLDNVMDLPNIEVVNPKSDPVYHYDVLKIMKKYKFAPRDAYHFAMLLDNNIDNFASYDSDFDKALEDNGIISLIHA